MLELYSFLAGVGVVVAVWVFHAKILLWLAKRKIAAAAALTADTAKAAAAITKEVAPAATPTV